MVKAQSTPLCIDTVTTTRGTVIENVHVIHAAVTDSTGRLLFSLGDPGRVTLIRSSAKPAQALAILETGAADAYGFDDADLALICASHNAEEKHVARATEILKKGGVEAKDLRCGGHVSLLKSVNDGWAKQDTFLTGVHSNCSGKHSAMLSAAKMIGAPLKGYHELDHPMQQRVKKIVEELAGVAPDDVQWAIDGCNMASPAYALHLMGKTFALFAKAADDVESNGENVNARTKHMARIFDAMTTHADMVAGTTRYCTEMMYAHKRAVFGKVGADACYGMGVRESERTRKLGAEGPVGIAVKVDDGNLDILYAALEEIMEQLGLASPEAAERLARFHHLRLANTMDVVIGRIDFNFKMRPATAFNVPGNNLG